jgi:hypothetical protein
VAQAAGEFVARDSDGAGIGSAAWQSCVVAAGAQLGVTAACTAVCLYAPPHRTRRSWVGEMLPTVLQTALCVLVFVLAARRHAPTVLLQDGIDSALDISGFLQPAVAVVLVLADVFF